MDSRYDPNGPEKLVERISSANRPVAVRYLLAKRAAGLRPSSLLIAMRALFNADRFLPGPLETASPDAVGVAIRSMREATSHASTHQFIGQLKAFYRWLHNGEVPRQFRLVLVRRKAPDTEFRHVTPISDDEFRELLSACADPRLNSSPAVATRKRAVLWLAWDSGFRCSELFALRIGSVTFDDRGGARVVLPNDAPDLKTGPRTIYVVESVGALRAWLALHPVRNDPKAPLFLSARNGEAVRANSFDKWLRALCKRAGLRAMHPHLFRHTRATRAAEAGWNEPAMRAYFGWSKDSRMAAHYVHLSQAHNEDRVRADANIDPLGARIREDPKQVIAELAAVLVTRTLDEVEARRRRTRDDEDDGASPPLAST
jgi:integrase